MRVGAAVVLKEWILEAISAYPGSHCLTLLHGIEATTQHVPRHVSAAIFVGVRGDRADRCQGKREQRRTSVGDQDLCNWLHQLALHLGHTPIG